MISSYYRSALCNVLLITMLIAILSNKFAAINQNAQQEVNETLLAPASFSPACSLTFFFGLLAPFPKSGENG